MESQTSAATRAAAARRPFFRRRKSCPFSVPHAPKIDYKDVKLLQRFISERGKIVPSRITAVSAKRQRERAQASQLPLFAPGLWLGTGAAALAALVATAILSAATGSSAAAFFAAVTAAPVVVLVRLALSARGRDEGTREWYPPGLLTAWMTALALLGTVLGVLMIGGIHGIETALGRALGPALDRLAVAPVSERRDIIRSLALILPGMLALSWMTIVVTNGILAQGVLA